MSTKVFKAADRVIGKIKANENRRGVIQSVVPRGNKQNYVVVWDNNEGTETVTNRAIDPEPLASRGDGEGDTEPSDSDSSTSSSDSGLSDDEGDQDEGDGVEADDEVDPLKPGGQVWTVSEDFPIDPTNNTRYRHDAEIIWQNGFPPFEQRNALQYFMKCFPMGYIQDILQYTNEVMEARQLGDPVTQSELFQWFGIQLIMAVEHAEINISDISKLWEDVDHPQMATRAADYGGRFGMSWERFDNISNGFRLAKDIRPAPDPWHVVRDFINAFNENMIANVKPGVYLTVDEMMSSWRELDAELALDGIPSLVYKPHQTKMARKREGVGAELKAIACGETGILLRIDILEGKVTMQNKPFVREYGAGTAVALRLAQPWFGTGRIIICNSAFASVQTLKGLWLTGGLYFMGAVETAHKLFPSKWCKQWFDERIIRNRERGSWQTLTSTYTRPDGVTEYPMTAIAWQDKKCKTIICNTGATTRATQDSVRRRYKTVVGKHGLLETQIIERPIKWPHAMQEFIRLFPAIETHNRCRQDSLAFERTWRPKTWWHRMFATLLGVVCTNSYFTYRFEYKAYKHHTNGMDEFSNFLGKLAMQLIDQNRPATPRRSSDSNASMGSSPMSTPVSDITEPPTTNRGCFHIIKPLSTLPYYEEMTSNRRAKRRCQVRVGPIPRKKCGKACSFYCVKCSNVDDGQIFCLCGPTVPNGNLCYYKHIA